MASQCPRAGRGVPGGLIASVVSGLEYEIDPGPATIGNPYDSYDRLIDFILRGLP